MNKHSEQPVIDALYRISRIVHQTEEPREALDTIADELIRILPADSVAIQLINPDRNCLEIEVVRGFRGNVSDFRLKLGTGISGWVAMHGKTLNIPDVLQDVRYVELDPSVRSELAVPIRLESGEILGTVNVSSHEASAFSEQDVKVLKLLTTEATRALSRLWFIQQLREKADHLEVLIDIARNIATQRDLDALLLTITTRALDIIPSKFCAIFLLDQKTDTLSLRACRDIHGSTDYHEEVSLAESSIGTVINRNKAIEIFDLPRTEENHLREVTLRENLASMLSCPINLENEPIGVLNIYTDYPHRFNDSEKRIFESLASLSATAIRNAELYERIFESEENLRRSERLTTLGLLSAEIAHEIRNPLTVIQLLFETLTLEFASGDPRNRDVHIIQEKLGQLESIVSRVLSFGKSQHEMRSRFNLERLIEDTLHLVRLKLKQSRIELVFKPFRESPLTVDVIKGQIQQAVLNLIINATQAIGAGGRIELSTDLETIDSQDYAIIRIKDTGPGIDPGIQNVIFDSFLTNRPDGTGLGLSIVKRILKSHNGSVAVESSSDHGTTMKLSLPAVSSPA